MTANPSPLPIPQAAPAANPLAQSLIALQRAVPKIDPEVAASVAQGTQSPGEAVNVGQAAQGYTEAVNTANFLKQQNSTDQAQFWNMLSASEQKLVSGTGYQPPHPGRSLWGTITHDVGQGVHDVLNVAGAPLRAEQHLERAAFAVLNQPGDPMSGSMALQRYLSPAEWAHAWNQTTNGEHYILPQVQAQVLKRYGQQTYDLAMKIATGGNAAQIVAAAPQAQQQALAQQIQGDPKFHEALQLLDAGHVSEGRMLAYRVLGLKAGSGVGQALAGATDATLDWFGDPVAAGAKAAKVIGTMRYLVQNGEDVQRIYQSNQAVQRAFADIADKVQAKDYTGLANAYPKLVPMFDAIRQWAPQSADDVANMFSDEANVRSIISGNAASLPGGVEGGLLPHLSFGGQARLAAKGVLQNSIDWMADRPATIEGLQPTDVIDHELTAGGMGPVTRLTTGTGQFLRKLLTLTPTGSSFNANDPAWFNKLRDVAMTALPRARANQLLNEYAASATLAGRRNIYAGMLKEVMASMGIDRIQGVSDWMDGVLGEHSDVSPFSRQSYAPGAIDQVWREGNQTSAGILRSDLTDEWAMPNFRDLYAQSKKLGIERAVNGSLNNQMVDRFMNEAWKPLALARFGFAVRVAGEEAFGALLRANPAAILRARAAGSMLHQQDLIEARATNRADFAARTEEALNTPPKIGDSGELEYAPLPERQIAGGPLAATWGYLTSHLPQAAQDRIKTPTDLIVEHMGDATSRAMAKVSGALAGEKYRNAVRLMADHGILDADGAFGRYVSASESHGGNFYDQAMGDLKTRVWNHGRWTQVRISPTGAYTDYQPTAQPFINAWHRRLYTVANDQWARKALELRTASPAERLQGVADVLKRDAAWSRASRSEVTTDGRYVGQEATVDEAANDHAKAIIDLVDSLTRNGDGEIPGLVDHLLTNRKPPSAAALDLIPEADRPAAVSGPEYIPVDSKGTAMWQGGVNRMFSIIGKQIDWISRQPMFVHNFAVSLDAFKKLEQQWLADAIERTETEADQHALKNVYYHGTPNGSAVRPVDYSGDHNLFGPGFYTTENPDVASSYATGPRDIWDQHTAAGPVAPTIYRLEWQRSTPPNLIDMHAEHLPDSAMEAITSTIQKYRPDLSETDARTLLTDSVRSESAERLPQNAAEEWFNLEEWGWLYHQNDSTRAAFWKDLHAKLQAAGFDGVQFDEPHHVGANPVRMFFDTSHLGAPIKAVEATGLRQLRENVRQQVVTAATDRAIKMTTPFIHNPEIRSQLEVIGRNIAPFMFAQEQFYKRWARTAAFSPWAFRQAQLINQGVYHSGFTHTDPATGQRYFVYPGAGAVQDVLSRSLGAFGYKAFLPIEANLRGQVKMASPGLERIGLPNLGPAVVVPLHFIEGIFPETRGPAQAIEGQQTASQSYISSLVPSTVSRVWQDFTSTPNNSEQFASAMMQAIQYLEASGHGIGQVAETNLGTYGGIGAPPVHAGVKPGDYVTDQGGTEWVVQADGQWRRNDPAALTAYMQRVKNWTRVFLITRTLFGFSAPASPENLFDPNHVNEDFQALLKELPYNEAVQTFMKLHPDASAYTVFQTKDQAGGPLPATASAMAFMDANKGFFDAHKLAGAFFIPTADSSGKFDQQAYQTQLQEQLRVRRTPAEFWQEIAYNNAATPYFNGDQVKNQMLQQGGNRSAIDQAWTEQSQQYMKANPLFAQQLADSGGTYKRADIETDLANALRDPRLPENPQTEDIRTLFNAWVNYQTMTAPYSNPNGGTMSSTQRYQLELQFASEATLWLATHPDAQPVFDRLMRPFLTAALTSQASTGA